MRPIQRPDAFSMTENIAKPWIAQAPAIVRKPRHATGRGCTPPTNRALSGSAMNAAQGSKSSGRVGRRSRRGVSSCRVARSMRASCAWPRRASTRRYTRSRRGEMKKSHVPVLIVGAGAAGTMLTLELARRGIEARTIDRLPRPGDTSKAITVHARTLEILERIDRRLVDRFLNRGIHNKGYVLHFVD